MASQLPILSAGPIQHPDCCASISTKLITNILRHVKTDFDAIASIGCGTGLLEALLLQQRPQLSLTGFEVPSCDVTYLPAQHVHKVKDTREVSHLALSSDVWLFVYPRTTSLMKAYVETYDGVFAKTIIWIGPKVDWEDHKAVFLGTTFDDVCEVEESGMAEYEIMVIIRRRARDSVADDWLNINDI
jgi:hypothetical protein